MDKGDLKVFVASAIGGLIMGLVNIAFGDILVYDPPRKEPKTVGIFETCEYVSEGSSYCYKNSVIKKFSCPSDMEPQIFTSVTAVQGNALDVGNNDVYPITAFQTFARSVSMVDHACSYVLNGVVKAGDPRKVCTDKDGNPVWCGECFATNEQGDYWAVFSQVRNSGGVEYHNNLTANVYSLCCPEYVDPDTGLKTVSPNCE